MSNTPETLEGQISTLTEQIDTLSKCEGEISALTPEDVKRVRLELRRAIVSVELTLDVMADTAQREGMI